MRRVMCKSKIQRARVTDTSLYYEGSLTVDLDILEAADILQYEIVQVCNVNTGERFETYVIEGERKSGMICLNGAAARLGAIGDELIIISYATFNEEELKTFKPNIIILNKENKIVEVRKETNIIEV